MARILLRLFAATSLLAALVGAPASPVAAGGGCHGDDGTVHTEGPSTVVKMEMCAFVPTVVHVPLGTTVRFLNTAPIEHLVVGESQSWGTDDTLQPGAELSRRFDGAGVFPFSCPLHPGMVGAIVVGGADATQAPAALAPAPPAGPAAGAGAVASAPSTSMSPWAPVAGLALLVVALALAVGGIVLWRRQAGRRLPAQEP